MFRIILKRLNCFRTITVFRNTAKMKTTTTILFIAIFTLPLFGQQLPIFTLYRDHWSIINPAYISNNYLINEMNMSVAASYRKQWWGIEGGPVTQVVNWEFVPQDQNWSTGAHIINDKTGLIGQSGAYGQFTYSLKFGRRINQSFVFGLDAGLVQYRAKISQIEWQDEGDAVLNDDNVIFPDFGFGMFYHYADQIYAGFSVPQTFGLTTTFRTDNGDFPVERFQHFYAVVGGYIPVNWFRSNNSFIEPSAFVRFAPNVPLSFAVNARYLISEVFWTGLGGSLNFGDRLTGALHFEMGNILGEAIDLQNSQLKLGLGFDVPIGPFENFGYGIEVVAVYSWYQ